MFDTSQRSYQDLRNIYSEKTKLIVAWVGAGCSVDARLPNWVGLRDHLCTVLREKASHAEPPAQKKLFNQEKYASEEKNLWNAFNVLKEAIGDHTYRTEIRRLLQPAESKTPPIIYKKLWSLGIDGMISLNLDRFSVRSYYECQKGDLAHFSGHKCGECLHILKSGRPFVAQLHGVDDEHTSWIFTSKEMKRLLDNPGYDTFIKTCLGSRTLVFIGISADDISAGGHLNRLTTRDCSLGAHFWITDRNDSNTRLWAEQSGLSLIYYHSINGDHSELYEMLDDLSSYISVDTTPYPIAHNRTAVCGDLFDSTELDALPAEDIRDILNSHASILLASGDSLAESKYEEFWKNYRTSIYRAWYVTDSPPDNILFGHKLLRQIGKGAFGRVFMATSPSGDKVAVKVLHGEVRDNKAMLQGFRRGVRSMRILSQNQIKGMVPYLNASEIPACAFMEWVEGANLQQAVISGSIKDWSLILRIARDIGRIIYSAHALPERVLHRDIRPANIMLRKFYQDPINAEVVVLDFDLSYHKDANEVSIDQSENANGYLAPEQIKRSSLESTRNARVDSFGFGMTCYFLRSEKHPNPSEHRFVTWRQTLTEDIAGHQCNIWKSLPRRYARLIEWATKHQQAERLDMTKMVGELEILEDALLRPKSVVSAELLAEEIAARSSMYSRYKWDSDKVVASLNLPTGAIIHIHGDESASIIKADLSWTASGTSDGRKVGKYINQACDKIKATMNRVGWTVTIHAANANHVKITGTIGTCKAALKLDQVSDAITNSIESLSLN